MFHPQQCSRKPGAARYLRGVDCAAGKRRPAFQRYIYRQRGCFMRYDNCIKRVVGGVKGTGKMQWRGVECRGGGGWGWKAISCFARACVTTHTACHYCDTMLSDWPRPLIMQSSQGVKPIMKWLGGGVGVKAGCQVVGQQEEGQDMQTWLPPVFSLVFSTSMQN